MNLSNSKKEEFERKVHDTQYIDTYSVANARTEAEFQRHVAVATRVVRNCRVQVCC